MYIVQNMRDDDISRQKQACMGCLTVPVVKSTVESSYLQFVNLRLQEEWNGQVVGTCYEYLQHP